MTPSQSLKKIQNIVNSSMSTKDAILAFIDFFENTNINRCSKTDDGDMLLFQTGTPWDHNPFYSLNLTRQYSYTLSMKQLSMDINFDPKIITLPSYTKWYEGESIKEFKEKVLNSEIFKSVEGKSHCGIEFHLGNV